MSIDESLLRRFDLNSLVTFFVIYRERGVTRAARALHVTQPAVSNSLNKLRVKFNDPLFVLYGRSFEPTEKAVQIAVTLSPLLEEIQALIYQEECSRVSTSLKLPGFESASC